MKVKQEEGIDGWTKAKRTTTNYCYSYDTNASSAISVSCMHSLDRTCRP